MHFGPEDDAGANTQHQISSAEPTALEAENEKLRHALAQKITSETVLKDLSMRGNSINMHLDGGACRLLADAFVDQFRHEGGKNFVEVGFTSRDGMGLIVTLQRVDGKTPAQLLNDAKKELADLAASVPVVPRFQWCCNDRGCGPCELKRIEFEHFRSETPDGQLIESRTTPLLVSACCSREVFMFDNEKQEEVSVSYPALAPSTVPDVPDMPAICAALGFDPTNHHNAAKCPYCRPTVAPSPDAEQPIPKQVLTAIRDAGLSLLKTQHGYQLRKLGTVTAQSGPICGNCDTPFPPGCSGQFLNDGDVCAASAAMPENKGASPVDDIAPESWHVIPRGDLREHTSLQTCWCKPVEDEPGRWIHNSMDGREQFETGERKPS